MGAPNLNTHEAAYLRAHAAWERLPVLVCRHCGADAIRSVDTYVGTCAGEARLHPDGTREFDPDGYTDIGWDSCKQIGWDCGSCYESVLPDGEITEQALSDALAALTLTRDAWHAAEESRSRPDDERTDV